MGTLHLTRWLEFVRGQLERSRVGEEGANVLCNRECMSAE